MALIISGWLGDHNEKVGLLGLGFLGSPPTATTNWSGTMEADGAASAIFVGRETIHGVWEADGKASVLWSIGAPFIITGWLGDHLLRVGLLGLGWLPSRPPVLTNNWTGSVTAAGEASSQFTTEMHLVGAIVGNGTATVVFTTSVHVTGQLVSSGVATVVFSSRGTWVGKFECDGEAEHIVLITFYDGVPVDGIISSLPPAVFAPAGNLFDGSHCY